MPGPPPSAGAQVGAPIDYLSVVADFADFHTVTGADGVYRYVSPACRRTFGWEQSDLVGTAEEDYVHPDDIPTMRASRASVGGSDHTTATYRFLCRDGSHRWTEATSRRVTAVGSTVVVSTVRDIAERRAHIMDLERQAFTDPLTGVANRTVLMDRLQQALRRLGRGAGPVLAVLYLDLDRFKVVNDSLGHRFGDAVLLQMAERLARHLRAADTLARLGRR